MTKSILLIDSYGIKNKTSIHKINDLQSEFLGYHAKVSLVAIQKEYRKTAIQCVLISEGGGIIKFIAQALDSLSGRKPDVVCMPLGVKQFTPVFAPFIHALVQRGALLVTPIGNDGDGKYRSPGCYHNVLSVGSIDEQGQPQGFSGAFYNSEGNCIKPDVLASSVCRVPFQKEKVKGTSISCAYVGGVAAQLWSEYPFLSNRELKQAIINSGDVMQELPNRHYNYKKPVVNIKKARKYIESGNYKTAPAFNKKERIYALPYVDEYTRDLLRVRNDEKRLEAIVAFKDETPSDTKDKRIVGIATYTCSSVFCIEATVGYFKEIIKTERVRFIQYTDINSFY